MATPLDQADSLNIFDEPLVPCGTDPLTGFYRDGCCNTSDGDAGSHTVCVEVSEEFLLASQAQGNDLTTPVPAFQFPGLKPGDHWCVCAPRWKQAYEDGVAPLVRLEATEETALMVVSLDQLKQHAHQSMD